MPDGKDRLSGFFWAEQERPQQPADVFLRPQRTPRPISGAVSAAATEQETETTAQETHNESTNRSPRKLKSTK